MKEAGLIIDLYQSSIQKEDSVKKAVSDFYNLLVRLLNSSKEINLSLNIPLSTLEILDKYGFKSLISDIKILYESGRIEIVGYTPYNSLVTKFPEKIMEGQIILNEYGVGYYLGSKQGFEGEPSIMIKDLVGFIPTLYHLNEDLFSVLGNLGYKWIAVDGTIPINAKSKSASTTSENTIDAIYKDLKYQKGSFAYDIEDREMTLVRVFPDIFSILRNEKDNVDLENAYGNMSKNIIEKSKGIIKNVINSQKDTIIFRVGDTLSYSGDYPYRNNYENIEILVECLTNAGVKINSVKNILNTKYDKPTISSEDLVTYFQNSDKSLFNSVSLFDKKYIENEYKLTKVINDISYAEYTDGNFLINMWNNEEVGSISDVELQQYINNYMIYSKYISLDKYYKDNSDKYSNYDNGVDKYIEDEYMKNIHKFIN